MKSFLENVEAFGLDKVIDFIESDFEKNLPLLLNWVERFDKNGHYGPAYRALRDMLAEPNNNGNRFVKSLYTDIDANIRRMLLKNFIVKASILGRKKQEELSKKEGCNVPWAILMDPTSACNLRCTGCWGAEYGQKLSMDLDTLDRIIREGNELGIYMFLYSGGEPLVRKKDIITLCEKHPDCTFLAFTNGTLIDEDFADEMLRVHNFVPAISIEGFEDATDSRRGKGTYRQVINAMNILKERRLLFGISTCYTSHNVYEVGSGEFIDAMIDLGAKFCWYFTYMPVGTGSPTDLMVTAKQREYMYQQVRLFRKEKPIFILDFWNDGEYVNGCIAGGRRYVHINANGDVEPCAFIHYSNRNIHDCSLLEALKSPLFVEYSKRQPFNTNHLRPCPLLDNPWVLAEMVKASGAHSTEVACPEDVDSLTEKCLNAAEKWAVTARRIWVNSPAGRKSLACLQPSGK